MRLLLRTLRRGVHTAVPCAAAISTATAIGIGAQYPLSLYTTAQCEEVPPDEVTDVEFQPRPPSQWVENTQRAVSDSLVDFGEGYGFAQALRVIRQAYAMPVSLVNELRTYFVSEAEKGLKGEKSSLAMLPTFVTKRVTGNETGDFFALDLGGTNFRVLRLTLEGDGKVGPMLQGKYHVPTAVKNGTAEDLFGFLADAVAHFLATQCSSNPRGNLGFTFSFPVEQTAINAGKLLFWNKGFSASGTVGADVVKLLQTQFEERGINLVVKALANDTVGTMEAAAYRTPNATLGVIFGTGTNGAYIEKTANISKWKGAASEEMVVNTEWGNLDMRRYMNRFDGQVDAASSNPGRQTFEKMVSGMYLGELCRVTLLSPSVAAGFSPECRLSLATAFASECSFSSADMAECEGDHTANLEKLDAVLKGAGVAESTFRDRVLIREACVNISSRAARLSAMSVVGTLDLAAGKTATTVAIDGTVFECYPFFKERMEYCLEQLLGQDHAKAVHLVLAKDGSGIGAAIIAAIAE